MPGTEQVSRSDDQALVASLRAGDEQVFSALVEGWSGAMMRLARSHVPTESAAEEVVQETWLAVLQGLRGFRGASQFRTWVFRILVNQAKARGARERRTVPFATFAADEWPEQVLLTREVHDVVARALAELPARQRLVVALRDVEGHTSDEVCGLLGISTGNQRVLLHRGRAVVRAHLEQYLTGSRSAEPR